MGRDESGTLVALKALRRDLIDPKIVGTVVRRLHARTVDAI
jgi:hypothetical protein